MRLTKVHHGWLNRQNRNKMGNRQRKLTANHQQFNNWIKQIIGFLTFPFFCSCFYFVFVCFVSFLAVTGHLKAFSQFKRWQEILLKMPTMQLNKVHQGKLNRQNRNKMGEDRQRKLIANHQQFNNWIKQLIGLEWNSF